MAENRAYLAAAGLFLAGAGSFGIVWQRAVRWRNAVVAAGVVAIAALSVMTVLRNDLWSDPIVLAREAVAAAPGQGLSRIIAADALRHQGRCAETIREYTMAIALQPFDERGYTRLARCFLELGSFADAERVLRQLRTVDSQSRDASLGLAVIDVLAGRPAESRRHLVDILGAEPADEAARTLLALIDGTLPADERVRTCDRLHGIVAARPVRIQLCESSRQSSRSLGAFRPPFRPASDRSVAAPPGGDGEEGGWAGGVINDNDIAVEAGRRHQAAEVGGIADDDLTADN
jgi:hypothetical protein